VIYSLHSIKIPSNGISKKSIYSLKIPSKGIYSIFGFSAKFDGIVMELYYSVTWNFGGINSFRWNSDGMHGIFDGIFLLSFSLGYIYILYIYIRVGRFVWSKFFQLLFYDFRILRVEISKNGKETIAVK
jgi:hypothetical protein